MSENGPIQFIKPIFDQRDNILVTWNYFANIQTRKKFKIKIREFGKIDKERDKILILCHANSKLANFRVKLSSKNGIKKSVRESVQKQSSRKTDVLALELHGNRKVPRGAAKSRTLRAAWKGRRSIKLRASEF